jgi:hypothetical protein
MKGLFVYFERSREPEAGEWLAMLEKGMAAVDRRRIRGNAGRLRRK